MKVARVIIAVLLTLVMLYIGRTNSRGHPEFASHTENGFTFEMITVPKALENGMARIPIKITGDMQPGLRPIYRQNKPGRDDQFALKRYNSVPLFVEDSASGLYYIEVSTGDKGGQLYYYFEIRDNTGGLRASFKKDDDIPFKLRFIGEVPDAVVISHVALMFATVFFVVLASLHALGLIRNETRAQPMARYLLLATVMAFLGGYPFGVAMNHYAFGTVWEGVPFGTDATDNKTQLLFVYLVFMVLATLGSLTGRESRNIYSTRTLGWFGLGTLGLMLGIYLIPHSIQFSPGLTYTVCYMFIGLIALLYVAGLVLHLKHARHGSSTGKQGLKQGRK